MALVFKRIKQSPRYRLVAQQIADRISDGHLKPRQKMPAERELVASLGVSRPTVREALIALEIEGYVENQFGAGMFVAARPPRHNRLLPMAGPGPFELLEARLLIEGEVAAMAAPLITKAEIARLIELTKAMEHESGEDFWGDNADEEFHLTIARATHNLALENTVRDFWRQRVQLPMWVQMHNRINVAELKPVLIAEHTEIIHALASKSPAAARTAMHRHISSFSHYLLHAKKHLEGVEQD